MRLRAFSMAFFLVAGATMVNGQSKNFNTGKSLEIQAGVLRILQSQYVDTVDMSKLVKTGIDAMLQTLDPYTVYLPEENEEDIEMMTTGNYGGVGSLIKKLPSGEVMISEPYENSPAVKVGLHPGDLILEIEGVSTKELTANQSSRKMRGEPGTELNMKVKKIRTGDTVDVLLTREIIHVPDVVYSGLLRDSIGYIQIGGFTLDGSKDVKKALLALKETGKMKKLILDLRGNGGGLITEAIDIVSLFVPAGTKVVSSKGRDESSYIDYKTDTEPIDTQIPLIVMVNSGSASASEIVSGALQDLDRALIVGTRTFGKGLVQSIRNVGYNTSLKITTAKYYTPSGRCVQAIDYSNRNEDGSVGHVPDSLKNEFKTVAGRSVYDGGGITPDITIEPKYYTRPIVALIYSDIMNDYSIDYFKRHEKIAPAGDFSLTDKEYNEFVEFASAKEFDSKTDAQIDMERVVASAKREGLYDESSKEMEEMLKKLSPDKKSFLTKSKSDVKALLEQEIVVKYYYQRGGAENALRSDSQIYKALDSWKPIL